MTSRRRQAEPVEPDKPSILQLLADEQTQRNVNEEFTNDVSVLFCGAKRSGKTSLVDRFINPTKDEKDIPKSTTALDYKFARYSGGKEMEHNSSKVLAHIYDLGGDDTNEGLVAIPISKATVGNLVVVLTIDLSEPYNTITNLERWLQVLREQTSKALEALSKESEHGAARVEALAKAKQEPYAEHPDAASVRAFPVPLVIYCTKWDTLTAEADPEKRKVLCRALRHFAHGNGAYLVCTALKDKPSMNSMRGVLRQLLFGVSGKGGISEQLDPAKPISVSPGKDSFADIGPAHGTATGDKAFRDVISTMFHSPQPLQKGVKKTEGEMVGEELQKYPENAIDGMVEQRIDELNQYKKQVERNQRLASEGVEVGKMTMF